MRWRLTVCAALAATAAGPALCQDIPKPSNCLSAALKLPLYLERQSQAQPGSELELVANFMVQRLEVERFQCRQLGWWVELQVTDTNREQMWSMAKALAAEGL